MVRKKQVKGGDVFAQIATNETSSRKELISEVLPVELPDIKLPSSRSNPKAVFKPANKMDSQKKLERELKRLRQAYKKFIADYAPPLKSCRISKSIEKFQWRIETSADQKDFTSSVLGGKGKWETVTIPHYGEPLGRATTYYRTKFEVNPAMLKKEALYICFKGVDYKASVFVNGRLVGAHEGFFTPFECEFTPAVKKGENILVVRVDNDAICMGNNSWGGAEFEGDKIYAATGCGYDDPQIGWHHCPPGMGIYQDVKVEARSRLHINDIFVRPLYDENKAQAWVEVNNTTSLREDISIELSLFGQNFKKTIFVEKGFDVKYAGPSVNYYRLEFDIPDAKKWQPDQPWLYQLHVKIFDTNKKLCDTGKSQFGMRKFEIDENCQPKGFFYLNDQPLRLRGANTMGHLQQCVVKKDFDQLVDDILIAKICNMNFLRLTQRPVQPEIYDYCDKLGMMLQTDLPLFGVIRRNQFCETVRQAEEMERLVRSHPSNIMISYINEPFPNGRGNPHRQLTRNEMQDFFESADKVVKLSNPDRVIKHVDGDYDPPCDSLPDNHCYNTWYNGHGLPLGKLIKGYWTYIKTGWNFGCGEFGSEGLEDFELMNERYPAEWLPDDKNPDAPWTPQNIIRSQSWNFHFMWYTTGKTQRDWIARSQGFQAWAMRTMTDAFRRDPRMVTIAIHLFIDAFPSGWMKTIMDVRRIAKPAFFAYSHALAPLAVNLQTDRMTYFGGEKIDFDVWACNDLAEAPKGLSLHYQIKNSKGKVVFSQKTKAGVAVCKPTYQGKLDWKLPEVEKREVFKIEAALINKDGEIIHDVDYPITVFPQVGSLAGRKISVLGEDKGRAWKLVKALGGKPVEYSVADEYTIICDSMKLAHKHRKQLDRAMAAGRRVVLTDMDQSSMVQSETGYKISELKLGGLDLKFETPGMNDRLFVSCDTAHPIVADREDNDFFMWFDENEGFVTPMLPLIIRNDELTPVLLSGQGSWDGQNWQAVLAAGEKDNLRVSCLELYNRVATNPAARQYALKLLP